MPADPVARSQVETLTVRMRQSCAAQKSLRFCETALALGVPPPTATAHLSTSRQSEHTEAVNSSIGNRRAALPKLQRPMSLPPSGELDGRDRLGGTVIRPVPPRLHA